MNRVPPRWADQFLKWYCSPELLEEIQGDVYELFNRTAVEFPRKARWLFIWNVFRFFRWKNIRKIKSDHTDSIFHPAMLKNILIVSIRNFVRYPGQSFITTAGLTAGFTSAFLILLWISHEFSYDKFHPQKEQLYKVVSHVNANGAVQTYELAGNNLDVASVPEIESITRISSGNRWPHELCFRPDEKPAECLYFNGVYANETLFSNFNFPILQGDPNPLGKPAQLAISQKMAAALYGTENPIGRVLKIDNTHEVTVSAVFRDVPVNSSIQFDFALPFDILKKQWGINDQMLTEQFFNIYLKTQVPVDVRTLNEKLNQLPVISAEYQTQNIRYEAFALTDLRLYNKFENGQATGGRIDYIMLFSIIGILVLAMAVINFINLSTARASLRAKEIGIRKVTGAFRGGLIAQFMGEAFVLVLIAFLVSAIFVQLVLPFFNTLIGEPLTVSLLNTRMIFFMAIGLILIASLAGFYPALVISSFQPATILKGQLPTSITGSQQLRKALMVIQLSVSVGIILFGSILYRQLAYIADVNLGFDRSNTLRLEPTHRLHLSYEAFRNELLSNPLIKAVGASDSNPLETGGGTSEINWPGKSPDTRVSFKLIGCYHDFPETIGLQLVSGSFFRPERQTNDSVAIELLITKKAAASMGMTNPIGEKLTLGTAVGEIIGIVDDFHTSSLHTVMDPVILYRKNIYNTSAIYIRYEAGMARQAQEAINTAYKKFEPSVTMKYWFQDDTFQQLYKTETLASRLVFIFSIIAMVITFIGVTGLATFNVMRKTKEIALRRVFGASVVQILMMLFNDFLGILMITLGIALPFAWYAARQWLDGFAYHTELPWLNFVAVISATAGLILLIIWIQGRSILAANPTEKLRSE
ncbi:MAG: ABC transporter permease [Cyclobacteriaceae bacterium]|nr:ABC transporter permease [Cyclobacteriaceae bacterium]